MDPLQVQGIATCDLAPAAVLATSELVTNALTHATGPVSLTLDKITDGRVWIGVHDASDRSIQVAADTSDTIGGRGLHIVEAIAEKWGVISDQTGKTIWLELATGISQEYS